MAKDTRIDKLFSSLGLLSRTDCKKAVRAGRIAVNGIPCKAPEQKIDPDADSIALDGETIDSRRYVFYMLNKPRGVITAKEPSLCGTVFDLVADKRSDLAAVGRLDKDTDGILLLTNDGMLCHRLLAPAYHVPKTYRAEADGRISAEDLALLERGLDIGDEKPTLPAKAVLEKADYPSVVLLTVTEGRYHQVKRMFEAIGKPVLSLHRQSFGPLQLDPDLKPGEYRALTPKELAALRKAAGMDADK